jgi:hypothetical protein
MGDVVISASQVIAAGQGYTVPSAQEITVRAVRAQFNGAAAAGSYVPTLQIVGDSGLVVAECPVGATVAAGASADVSWFPGVKAAASTAPAGGGLEFDTYPQAGQWLYLETDGPASSPGGFGVELFDKSGNGVDLTTHSGGPILLLAVGGGKITIQTDSADIELIPGPGGHLRPSLPSSDPGVSRALWVDASGFVKASP